MPDESKCLKADGGLGQPRRNKRAQQDSSGWVSLSPGHKSASKQISSLLQTPFDYSQAFDYALKDIVGALPNRPAKESAEDIVRDFSVTQALRANTVGIDVLLRLHWKLRRICMQSSNPELKSFESDDIPRRYCHQMLACKAKSGEERALQREKEHIPLPRVQGSDHDRQWGCKH